MYWGTGVSGTSLSGNVVAIPFPSEGVFETERAVDAARNASNVVVGQMVGRSADKQNMKWGALPCSKWWEINRFLEDNGMFFYCKYFAHNVGKWMIRRFYAGSPKCGPFMIDADTGVPSFYTECEVNVVDTGSSYSITVSTEPI